MTSYLPTFRGIWILMPKYQSVNESVTYYYEIPCVTAIRNLSGGATNVRTSSCARACAVNAGTCHALLSSSIRPCAAAPLRLFVYDARPVAGAHCCAEWPTLLRWQRRKCDGSGRLNCPSCFYNRGEHRTTIWCLPVQDMMDNKEVLPFRPVVNLYWMFIGCVLFLYSIVLNASCLK